DPLPVSDDVRDAALAVRARRRAADGAQPRRVLPGVLLAVHVRAVRGGLDEPRLDGGPFRDYLRGESVDATRRPRPRDWCNRLRARSPGRLSGLRDDVTGAAPLT